MVRQWQELFFDNRESGVDLEGNPDFVKLAEAYGIKGYNIKRPADVSKILEKALNYNEGPCVINDRMHQDRKRISDDTSAGAAPEDMLTEPPKQKMAKPVSST